ncbi:serine/threonine protein kinase PSK2 RNJ42_03315 [Nakaseomyces bracarensis]|uniref:serine/threonine protein kinase PSK2 n=1 Tax=Nakaseomyces bracarensis TaxID=273131 RepID=UPI003871E74C
MSYSSRDAFKGLMERYAQRDSQKRSDITSIPSSASASDTSISFRNASGNSGEFRQPSAFYKQRCDSTDSIRTQSERFDKTELMSIPDESTHTYSCNPESSVSLYVRLNIMRRAIQIMLNDPAMLEENKAEGPLKRIKGSLTSDALHISHLKHNVSKSINKSNEIYNSNDEDPDKGSNRNNDDDDDVNNNKTGNNTNHNDENAITIPKRRSITKRNSPAAALEAFVVNSRDEAPLRPVALERAASIAAIPYKSTTMASQPKFSPFKDDFSFNKEKKEEKSKHNKEVLQGLLNVLDDTLEEKSMSNASKLYKMSLLNIDKLDIIPEANSNDGNLTDNEKNILLKKTLLDSLAEPFVEFHRENAMNPKHDMYQKMNEQELNINMSEVVTQYRYNRVLHPFTSGKNSAPQAIFTCSDQHPWGFKAANDLACLTFGINKNVLRALTLLDLIHSDCRNFVLNKLMSVEEDQGIVFAGELIAIVQPNSDIKDGLIWATIWARKIKGSLVCVFEKVPCDYVDVMLNLDDFSVESINDTTGLLSNLDPHDDSDISGEDITKKTVKFASEVHDVKRISKSLSKLIIDIHNESNNGSVPLSIRVSEEINKRRYFTLNHSNFNIPCAVSSSVLENELKLKIHSAPYQVGLFIVERENLGLISCNKSISKNMFGYHSSEIYGKSIEILIPNIKKILDYIHHNYPVLDFKASANRGLVLTEHFFRKVIAEMEGDPGSFYNSVGLDACHNDGSIIKVDLQLRVLDENVFLLWISQTRDLLFENYETNPSQLSMLKESEVSVVSSRSSSTSSKKPSYLSDETFKKLDELAIEDDSAIDPKCGDVEDIQRISDEQIAKKVIGGAVDMISRNNSEVDQALITDPIVRENIELAKMYTKNKSEFVKEGNFKLDEEMIIKIVNTELPELSTEAGNNAPEKILEALNIKEPIVIGAEKRKKKYSDFVVLQKMGEGAYGKVNLCIHKEKKYIVVIKMIFKERILVDTWVRDRKLGTIPSEIQILATINKKPHENILGLLDFFEDEEYYYLETPPHGEAGSVDLFDIIEFKTNMTEFEAKLIFKQIVSGIKHLHDQGIVHRDIKDENVIVDSKGFIKLIDFGSAAYVKSGPFDVFVGTIDYAAPEVLGGNPYAGKPQDIWAIGILLYTIIFKENPFYNIDEILEGELRFAEEHKVSQSCTELISMILNRDLSKRPTIDDICEHAWLQI